MKKLRQKNAPYYTKGFLSMAITASESENKRISCSGRTRKQKVPSSMKSREIRKESFITVRQRL